MFFLFCLTVTAAIGIFIGLDTLAYHHVNKD